MYIVDNTTSLISTTFNVALNHEGGVPVICAWPLSGQYGPGARMLYYVLIIICIFAAHLEWMRGACLAAALLFPAVAAIHALIISSLSETAGPVDLDVFGTFQLCAIGVLTVPITIRYSRTYFETKGRNVVFMWTALNLAGLLSLIVAFYRADPKSCRDGSGNIVTWSTFESTPDICGPCDSEHTLIRKDPSNPAQWILAPHVGMTINTATLLSAACCIPSILSLLSVWTKVMHLNWLKRWRRNDRSGSDPELAGGGGDNASMQPQQGRPEDDEDAARAERFMEKRIKLVLGLVERIVFTACILAIVVLGERNFWSHEMREGVEPITSIGQWGPIVGAALAVVGSVWTSSGDDAQDDEFLPDSPEQMAEGAALGEAGPSTGGRQATADSTVPGQGHRGRVNKGLFKVLKIWGTPGAERFADDVRTRKYRDYPLIPGEKERNEHLERDKAQHKERQETIQTLALQSQLMSRRGSNASMRPSMDDARSVRTRANSSESLAPPVPSGSGVITPPAPARTASGMYLAVPERRYTNPQEASPVPRTSPDSPHNDRPTFPGVPMIMVEEAIDSDSDTSSRRGSPERPPARKFTL